MRCFRAACSKNSISNRHSMRWPAIGPFLFLMPWSRFSRRWRSAAGRSASRRWRSRVTASIRSRASSAFFRAKGLMELVKALAKFLVVRWLRSSFLWSKADEFLGLGAQPLALALENGAWLMGLQLSWSCRRRADPDRRDRRAVPALGSQQEAEDDAAGSRDELKETEGRPRSSPRSARCSRRWRSAA